MSDFRPQKFHILPNVIKNLVIICGLVFLTKITFGYLSEDFINKYLALHSIKSDNFKLYQLITHLFVHADFGHLFFNMFALWMFGSILENVWGSKKFIYFYLLCGMGAAIFHLAFLWYTQESYINIITKEIQQYEIYQQNIYWNQVKEYIDIPTVGASGAVFGCLAAFGYLFPNSYLYIYFLLPIKAKWFVIVYIFLELAYLLIESNNSQNTIFAVSNIARVAHLAGAAIGFLIVYIDNKKNRKTFY